MIYVGHPFGGIHDNKAKVEKKVGDWVEKYPHMTFISPVHAFGFLYNDVTYEDGMEFCLELLSQCEAVIFCQGWENSRGCTMEMMHARKHNIPVILESSLESTDLIRIRRRL